ncbi:phage holin family protein [Parabacteroides sp. OttesenSCG-928-G07]|nr:phage holin family protein [Parabacteroides sp. OttesenSCG-928-G07]
MEKDSKDIFRKLRDDITAYVEVKFELLKLSTYERTGKLFAVLSYAVILLFLAFFATLFLFLALGLFIGSVIGSISGGIAIVCLIYLLAILIIYFNKDRLINLIHNAIINALIANDDNDTEETNAGEKDTNTADDDTVGVAEV